MSAPLKTRRSVADGKLRHLAFHASEWRMFDRVPGEPFNLNELPEEQCRAANALLHAALAHCLSAPRSRPPKTLQGRRWYLNYTSSGCGRLEVSAHPGNPGIVSMLGALV